MSKLSQQRRMSDRQPGGNRFAEAMLMVLGAIVFVAAIAMLFFARPALGAAVEVLHPNWHLVCTLDTAHYTCGAAGNCALTVHCHGGTLFTNGFDGGSQ